MPLIHYAHINMRSRSIVLLCTCVKLITDSATAVTFLPPLYDPGNNSVPIAGNDDFPYAIDLGSKRFPFYGRIYSTVYVSSDGIIGFSPDIKFERISYADVPPDGATNGAFVAPYHYQGRCGSVYTRVLQGSSSASELLTFGGYIETAVVGVHHFRPTWGIIVTWYQVEDDGLVIGFCRQTDTSNSNTFQAVLLTDGERSFAIFNYAKELLENDYSKWYQTGFYGGPWKGWEDAIPYEELPKAAINSGSDVIGRYIFEINDDFIMKGGCSDQRNSYGSLVASPTAAGMLGGEVIYVSGPCLTPSDKIVCRFGDDIEHSVTVSGLYVNPMQGRCPVPRLLETGQVKLSLSIDQGRTYYYTTYINIEHPLASDALLETDEKQWNNPSADSIILRWKIDGMTHDPTALLDIFLVGYTETDNKGMWSVVRTIHSNIPADTGIYEMRVRDHPCIISDCTEFRVGVFEIRLQNLTQATFRRSLYSEIMPLGWYKNAYMTDRYGPDWPASKCTEWYERDRSNIGWVSEGHDCPCTLQQALVDVGRWTSSDMCNMFTGSDCSLHKGATHCMLSMQQTFSNTGNKCCYDKEGNLMFIQDTQYGSTPTRSNIFGTPPYFQPGSVPYMSYLLSDHMPYYYCCKWSQSDTCKNFKQLRKTKDCTSYEHPAVAVIYGQSHYRTFNNTYGRQCGEGDFVLVKSPDAEILGKFGDNLFPSNYSIVMGQTSVILTGVHIKSGLGNLEVTLKPPADDRSRRKLDVFFNGKYVTIPDKPGYNIHFDRIILFNSLTDKKQSNLTIILTNGIGIRVADTGDRLFAMVTVPQSLKRQIDGLLGTWNGSSVSTVLPSVNANFLEHYIKFQYQWATGNGTDSLFRYPSTPAKLPLTCANLQNTDRTALFCEDKTECLVDLYSTGNTTLANMTKHLVRRSEEIKSFARAVRSCGLLDIPGTEKNNHNYTLGSMVIVIGCQSGTLFGENTYSCISTGPKSQSWSPDVNTKCSNENSNVGVIVGVIIAVIVIIGIIIVIIVVVKRRRDQGKNPSKKKNKSPKPKVKEYMGVSIESGDTELREK